MSLIPLMPLRRLLLFALISSVSLSLYGQQGVAVSIRNATTDPAQCQPASLNVFFNTTSNLLKSCTASNTWTPYVQSGGAGGWPLLAPDGTSTAPSFAFAGATGLGIFRTAGTGLSESISTLGFNIIGATPVPTAATGALAGAGAGNVDNGTHSWIVTFVTAGGETTAGATSNVVTVADKTVNGKVSLTSVPTGNAFVTSRKIYRTIAGNTGNYLLLTTIADNTTTTYTDNTADAGLGAASPASNTAIDNRLQMTNAGVATFTGAIVVPAGSAAAPSVTGTGALTSGLFFPANAVSASVNGTQQLAMTANSTRLGPADSAAPPAQTITTPNVLAGTSNTAGGSFTIQAERGTGTGAGGSVIVQAANAGNSGTSQNTLNTVVTFSDKGTAGASAPDATFAGTITPSQTAGIAGTTTNNNANAGSFGEYVTGTTAANTTSLTTNTPANAGAGTNISLTAGDWDCTGVVNFTYGATTSVTNEAGGISTTTATLPAQDSYFDFETAAMVPTAGAVGAYVCPTVRLSLNGTTNVFLVTQATFTVSTIKAGGTIRCRRVR